MEGTNASTVFSGGDSNRSNSQHSLRGRPSHYFQDHRGDHQEDRREDDQENRREDDQENRREDDQGDRRHGRDSVGDPDTSDSDSSDDSQLRICRRRHCLILKMPKFDGDVLEYNWFRLRFKLSVEDHESNNIRRMFFLYDCLEGEAKRLMEPFVKGGSPTQRTFTDAMKLLEESFGTKYLIRTAMLAKLENLSPMKEKSYDELSDLQIALGWTIAHCEQHEPEELTRPGNWYVRDAKRAMGRTAMGEYLDWLYMSYHRKPDTLKSVEEWVDKELMELRLAECRLTCVRK